MDQSSQLRFYREMLRLRIVEEGIAKLYPEQEMRCPVHLSIGQEAPAVGVCLALDSKDLVLSGHRSHGHYLAKGGNLQKMMAEIYGKATGCCKGKGGSMHLIDLSAGFLGATPIVGSTIPIAVGTAFANRMRRNQTVTAVFFGDGATETGVFYESIDFAVLKKLPIVFVCENNLYSVYSPLEVRQAEGRSIRDVVSAHGMESHGGDGNNVEEVYRLAKTAVERARAGNGPMFLEFHTYRWREHCGPLYDNDIGYRTIAEFELWKERCPVTRMGEKLEREGVLPPKQREAMAATIRAEFDAAVAFARQSPFPEGTTLLEEVVAP